MSENSTSVIQETILNENNDNTPKMKRKKPVALIIVLLCIILFIAISMYSSLTHRGARVYGNLEWQNVSMTIDQKMEGAFLVKIINNSSEKINFGWVDSATAILHTTEGSYINKFKRTIPSHTSGNLYLVFPKASGIPESISFETVGIGIGANSTIHMPLITHIDRAHYIQPMNVFEITWAYIRWAYYWMISANDTAEIIIRIVIICIAVYALLYLFSLLVPRNTVLAKPIKKYIEETTHYQNGMCTGTTNTYYVVFLTDKGKQKKVDVRSKRNYGNINLSGWGLLTMKGIIFAGFEYVPSVNRLESCVNNDPSEASGSIQVEGCEKNDSPETSGLNNPKGDQSVRPWVILIIFLIAIATIVYLCVNSGTIK